MEFRLKNRDGLFNVTGEVQHDKTENMLAGVLHLICVMTNNLDVWMVGDERRERSSSRVHTLSQLLNMKGNNWLNRCVTFTLHMKFHFPASNRNKCFESLYIGFESNGGAKVWMYLPSQSPLESV